MIRILAATMLLGIASPCLACNYSRTTAVDTPTTVASQPQQSTPCPNCVTPDSATPKSAPNPGAPS